MQTERDLIKIYKNAHNYMRSIDGLQPQEALDELMKYLFVKQIYEEQYGHIKKLPSEKIKIFKKFQNFLREYKVY